MEYICEVCGFKAKNANGLRLHSRIHKDGKIFKEELPKIPETIPDVLVESEGREIVTARIKLYDKERLVIEYPINGQVELDKAKAHAEKKGYKIEIENLVRINI